MRDDRAIVELAFLLPFAGAALLLPGLLDRFTGGTGPWGLPALVTYVFAVWLALILLNLVLSRALGRAKREDRSGADSSADGA